MNNNATKKKLALNKTSLRELTASEWEMVGGGMDTEYACSGNCPTNTCTYTCATCDCSYNCMSDTCVCYTPTYTCTCTYGCLTDTCPPK
jgi:hypothetical protein